MADGTSPTNWDTDSDWKVDWFEVNEEGTPIRYDRQ